MAYFANGSEGAILEAQCAECPIGDKLCPVRHVQEWYNYEQIGNNRLRYALELLVDEKGICQLKPLLEEKSAPTMLDYLATTAEKNQC